MNTPILPEDGPDLSAQATQWAEAMVRTARQVKRIELDYSVESLAQLELFVRDARAVWSAVNAPRKIVGKLAVLARGKEQALAHLRQLSQMMAAYLGEVLVRQGQGRWVSRPGAENTPASLAFVRIGMKEVFVFDATWTNLTSGSGHSPEALARVALEPGSAAT